MRQRAVAAASDSYRPLHRQVREIQGAIRRIDVQIKDARADIKRVPDNSAGLKKELEDELARLEAEKKERAATIPGQWEEQHKKFVGMLKAEKKARTAYRRNVDSAYSPIGEAVTIIGAADALATVRPDIEGLREIVTKLDFEAAAEKVKQVSSKVGAVAGARKVRSSVSKVRRALRGRSPDKEKALKALDKALEVHAKELQWRQAAAKTALPGLVAYESAIRDTIGLRQQAKLPEDKAPEIAGCMAYHRDISLSF